MIERPILFKGEMVRAILDGRKTQTRRIVKTGLEEFSTRDIGGGCTETIWSDSKRTISAGGGGDTRAHVLAKVCPYGKRGDRLWVRETYAIATGNGRYPVYRADAVEDDSGEREGFWIGDRFYSYEGTRRWFPSIHMPRWASRIMLEITDVRVQRLQEISEEDAVSEGMVRGEAGWASNKTEADSEDHCLGTARFAFANLINSLHGGPKWNFAYNEGSDRPAPLFDQNPWVWAISFKRIES